MEWAELAAIGDRVAHHVVHLGSDVVSLGSRRLKRHELSERRLVEVVNGVGRLDEALFRPGW